MSLLIDLAHSSSPEDLGISADCQESIQPPGFRGRGGIVTASAGNLAIYRGDLSAATSRSTSGKRGYRPIDMALSCWNTQLRGPPSTPPRVDSLSPLFSPLYPTDTHLLAEESLLRAGLRVDYLFPRRGYAATHTGHGLWRLTIN